jgi:BASS family bile acid:Na+ symporter
LLTMVIPLERGHAVGLLLLGAAAGAPFLPKLTGLAHGDSAVAIALMILLTLGTMIFLPIAVPLLIPGSAAAPWSIAGPLVLLILLPLAVGMLLKSRAGGFSARAAPVLARLGNASLLLLLGLVFSFNLRTLFLQRLDPGRTCRSFARHRRTQFRCRLGPSLE